MQAASTSKKNKSEASMKKDAQQESQQLQSNKDQNPEHIDLPQDTPSPQQDTEQVQHQAQQLPEQQPPIAAPPMEPDPTRVIVNATLAETQRATIEAHIRERKEDYHPVEGEIFCFPAMFPNYAGETEQDPLQVFKATSDPGTMYHHEAMQEADADKFKLAMLKEWDDQKKNWNSSIIKRSQVPEGENVLPAVWQMKRKRDIRSRAIKSTKLD